MDSVCAILLNWNQPEVTIACLESLADLEKGPATLLVCDNGSTDGSPERLLAWARGRFGGDGVLDLAGPEPEPPPSCQHPFPFVLIRNQANLGYAAGNNAGLRYALGSSHYQFLWILNNDTEAAPGALRELLACAAKAPETGIFGSTVVQAAAPEVVEVAGGCRYYPLFTLFRPVLGGRPLPEVLGAASVARLDYVYGAALFARREVFETCGLLNEEHFLFYEEIDFCRRATKAGFGLDWCRQSIVRHHGSHTVGRPDSGDKARLAVANYHETLSTLIYSRNFHHAWLPVSMHFRFWGKLSAVVWRRQWFLIPPLFQAFRDFWRLLKEPAGTERERLGEKK